MALQPAGSQSPFFCVHGVGGNVVGFRDLARHLGSDQPFYGIQPQGLDGKQPCLTSVPEMAEQYLQEIRKVSRKDRIASADTPSADWSRYEMAQMLLAQGEEVALLALFDTYPGKMESRGSQSEKPVQASAERANQLCVDEGHIRS